MFKEITSKKHEIIALSIILIITSIIYLNHFDNPFFFDDTHTITYNESIRNLANWPDFFTNADTFSSLPANRSYRPIITLMNAIDYNFAGGLNSSYYHYHIFFWFLILIIFVYSLSKKIYSLSFSSNKWIIPITLFGTTWFALHTANAETINYICARSDSFTTLCVVCSLLLYINPNSRKWHLYLITMMIGIWTKQTGVMFFPILLVYIILFEEFSLIDNFKTHTYQKVSSVIKKIAPTAIISISLFIFNQYYLTPKATISTNFEVTRFEYISTQFFITLHYLSNFILPFNLSADPDFTIIKPWYDIKIISSIIIIIGILYIMFKTALKKQLRPISFGIAWFFIALIPTAVNPLFQIANDHRMFFPFIGLFIAIPWSIYLILKKSNLLTTTKKPILYTPFLLLLAGHAYGTIERNKIWNSEESLWKDVSIKSPKNGRGLMNYGLTQMAIGEYDIALEYFTKADKLSPNYHILQTNFGILYAAKSNHTKAEHYFKLALNLNSSSPSAEYYYARYLFQQKKFNKSQELLQKALKKSPNHIQSKQLLNRIISSNKITIAQEIALLKKQLVDKSDKDKLLNLSLKYYQIQKYELVISTCKELLKIDPNNSIAYNNICSAYNQLKKWKLGAEACKKALKINPNYKLAKNNLKWATDNIK